MFAAPTTDQIHALARHLGLTLSPEDILVYRRALTDQLGAMEAFLNERLDESPPELRYPVRGPGERPSEESDPYNAWVWRCDIGGSTEGLLAGKTVSFKDHIEVAGLPVSWGSKVLDDVIASVDASVVERVLAEGGRVVGKNTHHGFSGLRSIGGGLGDYWDAVNPRNPVRQAGGSSSGPAAAVAAGEVDIAIGGDQGGSIRQPAAHCGILGLKPTFGLVSHAGAFYGGEPSIDHLGPMARTVEDIALALQAVAGYDGRDSRQGRDIPDSIDVLRPLHTGVRGLRVGLLDEGFSAPHDERITQAVVETVEALRDAGAIVSTVSVPEHHSVLAPAGALQLAGFRAVRGAGPFVLERDDHVPLALVAAMNRAWTDHADQMAAYLKLSWMLGEFAHRTFRGTVYAKAHNVRRSFVRAYDRALREVDVLAMPTCLALAPVVDGPGEFRQAWRREIDVLAEVFPHYRNVQPFNYTGHPALAVPCGEVDGTPISVQLVGKALDEATLLRVAKAITSTSSASPSHLTKERHD